MTALPNSTGVQTVAPPVNPDPAPQAQLPPRVYIQIRDESQRAQAVHAAEALRKAKFVVPGIAVVTVGPTVTELRYLQDDEEDDARRAVAVLADVEVRATLRLVRLKGRSRDRHYELWLAPPAASARW